ncbi:MAG: Na(+)-translocating NADH-quinone reductase subunit A [Bacteroidales bacterium]|nr:Na(+)-translocating NADH-quinone reductase subunit A [Bacteroidales bacterium]
MSNTIKIKKGLDIPLQGAASGKISDCTAVSLAGIVPDDFPGYKWKAIVKPGEKVKCGDPLLTDKETGRIFLTSPLSGSVEEIRRGERRKILAVTVRREDSASSLILDGFPFTTAETIKEALLRSGLWAMMRQRPYDVIPDPSVTPRDIFITALDSAPLAPALFSEKDKADIQSGVAAMRHLTSGNVYLTFPKGKSMDISGAKIFEIEGPHPAGNVSVQIDKIDAVNKGETVWALDIATLIRIGKLSRTGVTDYQTSVAVTGPLAIDPHIITTIIGAEIKEIIKPFMPADTSDVRVISGNVLTGKRINPQDGFLRYPYRQITLLKEGAHADEFMGWASLSPDKYSVKRNFPAFLRGLSKPFPFDARIKGGHRAMILSEEYDKVFPMDIYPEFLLKAIMARDIDKMEQLGIYEVAPEDFALPEFVDTSKIELQKIVREGLDYLRNEI